MGKKERKPSIRKKGKNLIVSFNSTLELLSNEPDLPEQLKTVLNNDVSWQQRQELTVLQSLSSPTIDPRWLASLLAFSVQVKTAKEDDMPLSDFTQEKLPSSLISELSIPLDEKDMIVSESKVGLTPADKPIVSAICSLKFKDKKIKNGNIVLTGVWKKEKARLSRSSVLLKNKSAVEEIISDVVEKVLKEISPVSDFRGSEEYRRSMAGVVTKRALEKCLMGVNQK